MAAARRGAPALHRLPAACLWLALLAGCGGGGDAASDSTGGATPPPPAQSSVAVAFQSDASHSGVSGASTPTFPLQPSWQRTFGSTVSYPLIADGKVFILVAPSPSGAVQLVAIDQTTGLDAWPAMTIGTSYNAGHAYDRGRVFVSGSDNILRSFDAATGVLQWSTLMLSYFQAGVPVARDGKVYVSAGNGVSAFDGQNGGILWTTAIQSPSTVSLSDDGVLLSSYCGGIFALLQTTGVQRWNVAPLQACNVVGSMTVAHSSGRVYVRDYDYAISRPTLVVRDAATGTQSGAASVFGPSFPTIPAVSANGVYFLNAGTLQRLDPSLQTVAWSFAGDGSLSSAPLLLGSVVVIGGYNGKLYAVDAASGVERWSALVPSGIDSPQDFGFTLLTGMAAANGILVVPNGRNLSTWRLGPP